MELLLIPEIIATRPLKAVDRFETLSQKTKNLPVVSVYNCVDTLLFMFFSTCFSILYERFRFIPKISTYSCIFDKLTYFLILQRFNERNAEETANNSCNNNVYFNNAFYIDSGELAIEMKRTCSSSIVPGKDLEEHCFVKDNALYVSAEEI